MESIIQTEKCCFLCGSTKNLNLHHCIHGVAHRKISDQEGLTIYLCVKHHTGSKEAVHLNPSLDLEIKQLAERVWLEKHNNNIGLWMKLFRRNYL